jgi:hypothetical protein
LDYFADAACKQRLGSITFTAGSRHILANGILSLSNVSEIVKGGNKNSYALRHNDAQAMGWWNETLRLAELERKRRP